MAAHIGAAAFDAHEDAASEEPVPSISVVIAAHDAERTLAEQLEALCGQEYEGRWDVIVVDNRSMDATVAVAHSYDDRLTLRVVGAASRASAAYARNVGAAASTAEVLVFVDADDVAAPGLLAAYGAAAGTYAVMGGRIDDLALNDPVTASWRYPLTDGRLPVALGHFSFCLAGNCAVRRDVYELIGGFDETLAFVGEEVDFSIRAKLAGFEVGWVPEAVVHYRHRPSLRALARQQYIYGRGAVVLYDRYRAVAVAERRLPVAARQLLHLAASMPNLGRGRVRRGQWVRWASFMGGQCVESVRRRVLYVG